jgi:hypothetical protein
MLSALGLSAQALIVSTPPEFTVEETKQYVTSIGYTGEIPVWLPRKPITAEMYGDFAMRGLMKDDDSRPLFWENFIDALCRRDAKIRHSYDPEIIKQIICRLSRITRMSESGLGPITPLDVQEAFKGVVGQFPAQEAASMLQRLPGLGRVAAETEDRQFADNFLVEGLRGLDVVNIVSLYETEIKSTSWKHGIGELGTEVVASLSGRSFSPHDAIKRIQSERGEQGPLHCDIVSGLVMSEADLVDFHGIEISGGYIATLDLSEKKVCNLHISSSEIKYVNIFNCDVDNLVIKDCVIEVLDGASGDSIPSWIEGCVVGTKSQLDTTSRIKKSPLKPSEMILVTILRKTFFQAGSGRKEEALLRGLGQFGDAKLQNKILSTLCTRSFLNEAPGSSGRLFIPERSKTPRARQMLSQLQQSRDEIWLEVSGL